MNAHGEIFNEDDSVNGTRLIADLRAYRIKTPYGPAIPMLAAIAADHIESVEAEKLALLRRVDELETRVAQAESSLQGAHEIIESQHAAVERYEFMRCMRPDEFTDLWRRCLKNEGRFDDLVDDAMRKLKDHESGGEGSK